GISFKYSRWLMQPCFAPVAQLPVLPMIITGLGATLLAQFTGGKPLYSAILARTLAKQEAEQLARSKAASASENT
ncbi:hypothetical protein ACUOAQ_25240, partial [Escherichia sp. SP-MK]